MWTRRRVFPTLAVPATPHRAALTTPLYDAHANGTSAPASPFTLADGDFNFVGALAYTLVPNLDAAEAQALLSWALPPAWAEEGENAGGSSAGVAAELRAARVQAAVNAAVRLGACTQVEYFFVGTDNGHAFLMPLLPPHLLQALVAECGEAGLPGLTRRWRWQTAAQSAADAPTSAPLNCVARRLLHRHAREEPATVVDHLGTLFASAAASGDTSVALSVFHPVPSGITCLPHPSAVRSIKLWDGSAFTSAASQGSSGDTDNRADVAARRRWQEAVRVAEPTAVYVFTGDDAGLVRLWRVDVVARTYALQHVLVCSASMTGMTSPVSPFAREDNAKAAPSRDADRVIHCLEVDNGAGRLLAGTEGGVCVWAIDRLPWRGGEPAAPVHSAALAMRHVLCWDESHSAPLPCALPREGSDDAAASAVEGPDASDKVVAYRAARLANHHVWVESATTVQAELARAAERGDGAAAARVSGWKPKYGRAVTGGAAVGVVSNTVQLAARSAAAPGLGGRLTDAVVCVSFEGGELRNDLRVPLSCVVPVVYPLAFLRTPGTACFAVRVLSSGRRVVTSCADGKVCVWACTSDAAAGSGAVETYAPQLVTSTRQEHRGLGQHVCVLRAPDVFVTCSYDDGLVKEWHVYDEPEVLLRCARRFTLTPYAADGAGAGSVSQRPSQQQQQQLADAFKNMLKPTSTKSKGGDDDADRDAAEPESSEEDVGKEEGDVVGGIACTAAFPPFGALFLVGAFESAIQTYSLTEVVGCEPPRNYVYNGHKTVRLPGSMAEDVYHEL